MLRNYLTIALRNLRRNKLHALINITGLSIGISACLVLFLIVDFELGFDRFRTDRDRIYRVYTSFSGAFEGTNPGVASGMYNFLEDRATGLESQVVLYTYGAPVTIPMAGSAPKELESQPDLVLTQPSYFEVFPDYEWISGSPGTALSAPNQVVLTDEKAKLYFNVDDPEKAMGQTLFYHDSLAMTVSGIIAAPPAQTDFQFQDFLSFATVRNSWLKDEINLDDWESTTSAYQVFVKLAPGITTEAFEKQLEVAEAIQAEADEDDSWVVNFHLQPLSDLHFNSELSIFNSSRSPAHLPTLYGLIFIAILLLVIAGINFVNLETAQAVRRAREVGVRKVLGGTRRELMLQFIGETFILTLIAVVLSVQLAELGLTYFEEFIPDGVELTLLDPVTLGFLILLTVVVAVLAGAYPAFVLSNFQPIRVLKEQVVSMRGDTFSANLRRGLIVFQFVIAQALIFGAFIAGRQLYFMIDKDMGFKKDEIVYFYSPWRAQEDKREVLKEELKRLPEVTLVSRHESPPARRGYSTSIMGYRRNGEKQKFNVHRKFGDTAFIHLYELDLLAGRNLLPADSVTELVINETFARRMGFENPAEVLGAEIEYSGRPVPVVGVVEDFHIQSLHSPIEPTAIAMQSDYGRCFSLRLRTGGQRMSDFEAISDKIEALWKRLYPDHPFKLEFMDETVAGFYEAEQRTAKLVRTATGIAILISCLGLLGLVSYTATQRTREIGIRKVLGASVPQIITLLTRDFLWLVLIAGIIALPIAWYGMNRWLDNFAYRIDIQLWMFGVTILVALLVALLTVGWRALRAARANPADSLKYE